MSIRMAMLRALACALAAVTSGYQFRIEGVGVDDDPSPCEHRLDQVPMIPSVKKTRQRELHGFRHRIAFIVDRAPMQGIQRNANIRRNVGQAQNLRVRVLRRQDQAQMTGLARELLAAPDNLSDREGFM